jgi:enamine deaminase RidA (YjgF/YER057c/UK114 family)
MTHYIKVASLFPPPDYAHAAIVEGDRLVFTAGAVPLDAAGELVGPGDFIAQTKQVLVNLDAALRAAGSDLEHVVNTTIYVVATDRKHLSDVWSVVRDSGLGIKPHTSTLLGASMLGYSGQRREVQLDRLISWATEVLIDDAQFCVWAGNLLIYERTSRISGRRRRRS